MKDIYAIVRDRLKEMARKDPSINTHDLWLTVALERAVARLEASETLRKALVFKGGFVLFKEYQSTRYTKDVDAAGHGISEKELLEHIKAALNVDLKDGITYFNVQTSPLKQQGGFPGVSFLVNFHFSPLEESKKKPRPPAIKIDIVYGDQVKNPKKGTLSPTLNLHDAVSWRVYPPEFIVSEKLHALVKHGSDNSRSKDIFDIALLCERGIDIKNVVSAIKFTFEHQGDFDPPSSFTTFGGQLDTDQLEKGWAKFVPSASKQSFQKAWKKVLSLFDEIDGETK